MKIKEMKEKGIEFVKENKAALAFGGTALVYSVGMYLWGFGNGRRNGVQECYKHFKKDIGAGQFIRELECGPGHYKMERFFNEDRMSGKINSFTEAVKLLSDPENTENVCGLVVLSKENN